MKRSQMMRSYQASYRGDRGYYLLIRDTEFVDKCVFVEEEIRKNKRNLRLPHGQYSKQKDLHSIL